MWVGGRAGAGLSQANYFLDATTEAQAKKEKKRKVGLHRDGKLFASKGAGKRVKGPPTGWEKAATRPDLTRE